jgi:hypothetical protein
MEKADIPLISLRGVRSALSVIAVNRFIDLDTELLSQREDSVVRTITTTAYSKSAVSSGARMLGKVFL